MYFLPAFQASAQVVELGATVVEVGPQRQDDRHCALRLGSSEQIVHEVPALIGVLAEREEFFKLVYHQQQVVAG